MKYPQSESDLQTLGNLPSIPHHFNKNEGKVEDEKESGAIGYNDTEIETSLLRFMFKINHCYEIGRVPT